MRQKKFFRPAGHHDELGAPMAVGDLKAVDRFAKVVTEDPRVVVVPDEVIGSLSPNMDLKMIAIPRLADDVIKRQLGNAMNRLRSDVAGVSGLDKVQSNELAKRVGTVGNILVRRSAIDEPELEYKFKHELVHHNGQKDPATRDSFDRSAPLFRELNPTAYDKIFLQSQYYGRMQAEEVWVQFAFPSVGGSRDWDDLRASIIAKSKDGSADGDALKDSLKRVVRLNEIAERDGPKLAQRVREGMRNS